MPDTTRSVPAAGERAQAAAVTAAATGPQIVNPAEELATFSATGILRWSEVAGADAYEVWAYRDAALTQQHEFSAALTSRQYQFTKLAAGQTYYVKLYYRVGGTWRELPSFTLRTTAAVSPPRLTNSQEELDYFGTSATFRWTAVANADIYELWVYRDAAFTAFVETSGPVRITQYRVSNLAPGQTYCVRVYARVSGSFMVGGALAVRTTEQLTRARILNPQEELDVFATDGLLRWSSVTGATAYELWVFTNPNSSEIYESSGSLKARTYKTRTLKAEATYYAQAYALVNGQWQVGAPVKITTAAAITKSRLTSPQEDLDAFSPTGTLRWTEVAGATAYEMWIYGNAGLGTVVESGRSADRTYAARKLCPDATYYATVYALVNGEWTSGWATRIDTAPGTAAADCVPPAPLVKLSASTYELVAGGTVTLTWSTKFATTCTASDAWTGDRPTSGQLTVGPLASGRYLYSVRCAGPSGSSLAQVGMVVNELPPTVTLSVSPSSVGPDSVGMLTWSSRTATSCSGSWAGSTPTSGTYLVSPKVTSTYQITCTGAGGTANSSATLVVTSATYTVAGDVFLPSLAVADTDTNDSRAPLTRNDTFSTAQVIPNPAQVGGHVTVAGAGKPGALQVTGDRNDYFRVAARAGQVVELTVASPDPATNDADLYLYDAAGTLVDSSRSGTSRRESFGIRSSGTFYIRVYAFSGATNYVLSVGQAGTAGAAASPSDAMPLRLSSDFRLDEAIVRLESAGSEQPASRARRLAADYGLELVSSSGAPEREMLVRFNASSRQSIQSAGGSGRSLAHDGQVAPRGDDDPSMRFASDEDRLKYETLGEIKRLQKDQRVRWAEPNLIVSQQAVPNDPFYTRQRWHYELMGLPSAWDVTTGSASVVAAVLDTGIQQHPDLSPNVMPGFDFVMGDRSGDGDGVDPDPTDPGTFSNGSFSFHGTHVAGTVGARGNDGLGGSGVAWQTRLMPIRVLGIDGSGSAMDVAQGIRYAAGLANDSGSFPQQRADVINLSLGSTDSCPMVYQQAIDAARARGVIIVASAGNKALASSGSPGNCNGVTSVAAVNPDRMRAYYSNFGSAVDVAAPGGELTADRNGDGFPDGVFSTWSAKRDGIYYPEFRAEQGTSMAAPHVSGVVALMKAANPALTPARFDALLAEGALTEDIGPPGPDELGVGLLNAAKAVRAVAGGLPVRPGQLAVSPSVISFGDSATKAEAVLTNSGDATVTVAGALISNAWITVAAVQTDANKLGRYAITVDRSTLAPGAYSGFVEFRGTTGLAVRVAVLVEVATVTSVPTAGYHYVLLVDPLTRKTRYFATVYARGSSVGFQIPGVPPGQYLLFAGTDMNFDFFICDDGESCANYPVYGREELVEVSSAIGGLKMTTSFRSRIASSANTVTSDAQQSGAVSTVRWPLAARGIGGSGNQ